MLVLSRKANESVQIDSQIQVTILSISKGRVKIGIKAPNHVSIVRNELIDGRTHVPEIPQEKGTQAAQ
jgi:carbon storage regulator